MEKEMAVKIAVRILFMGQSKKLTAGEMATIALRPESLSAWRQMGCDLSPDTNTTDLARNIGAALAHHVNNTAFNRSFIQGTKRGWSLGPRAHAGLAGAAPEFSPPESTHFTGLSGEYAVISELLACDWNTTKLPVDDGVDVIATQGHEIRTIQVKTAHAIQSIPECFQFQIDREAHNRYSNIRHYYVLVMRRRLPLRWLYDFMLLSSNDVESLYSRGAFYGGENGVWTVRVEIRGERYFLRGDDEFDMTEKVNKLKAQFR